MNLGKKLFGKRDKNLKQKLGIDVPAIVNKFMSDKARGFVDKTEFNYFWLAMKDDAPDVDVYIHLLVQHLLNYMSNKNNKKLPFNPQVLLNTINFLVLRHPSNKQSKAVRDILTKWNKNRLKYNDQTLPAAKDVLGVLFKQRVEDKSGLDSLIIQCYQFYSHSELSRIADYYENPTIIHVVDGIANIGKSSGDKVCIWPYLKDLASRDPNNFRLVIQKTIEKLRSISGQILLLPKLAEISLLALIFMMRQLLSYTRVPDEEQLDKSIINLKRFYLWPVPYGSQARDLLIKLQKERVAPGFALIQKVWRECRLPEIELNHDDDDQSIQSSHNINHKSNSFRPLYYLFDLNDSKSLMFANTMKIDAQTDWGSNYKVHSGPSAYISAILILNIISYDCGKSDELENAIKKLNENEIINFYKQVIEIFVQSASSGNDSKLSKESRSLGFGAIRSAIIDHASDKSQDMIDDGIDDEDLEDHVIFTEDIDALKLNDYRVELPGLHHTGIGCNLKSKFFPSSGQMASNEMLYPSNEVLLKLTSLLKNLHSLTSNDELITLRFMISGGNSILNGVCTAYASLVRHAQPLLENFNLEFFILPYSKNHYSEWLARQDPWYNRHIYLPLQSRLFVAPSLLSDIRGKKQSHGHLHTVGQYYREMSENYAHEADQTIKLRLWECLCWDQPPYTKTPHKLIPFCQRIELGKIIEYNGNELQYQTQEQPEIDNIIESIPDEYKSSTILDENDQKLMDEELDNFDYAPIPLDIEWIPVDMLGRPAIQSITQKSQYVDQLFISSCPRYGDLGFPASPNKSGVVHLYSKIQTGSTKKKKFIQEYSLLKNEPSQHVRTATITSGKASQRLKKDQTTNTQKKNNSFKKFYISVDDEIYGKFSRIKIQPMIDPSTKEQVYMPIRTFFPVSG